MNLRYKRLLPLLLCWGMMCMCLSGCQSMPAPGTLVKEMTEAVAARPVTHTSNRFSLDYTPAEESDPSLFMELVMDHTDDEAGQNTDTELSFDAACKRKNDEDVVEHQTVRIFTEGSGKEMTSYVNCGGCWTLGEVSALDLSFDGMILGVLDDYKDTMRVSDDMVTIGDSACYELKAVMAPMDVKNMWSKTVSVVASASASAVDWSERIPDLQAADLTLYLDAETKLPRSIRIDAAKSEGQPGIAMQMVCDFPEEVSLELTEDEKAEAVGIDETEPESELPELAADAEILVRFAPDEYVVTSNEEIRVDLLRMARNVDGSLVIDLQLVNDTAYEVEFISERIAVNYTMCNKGSMYQHVRAGESVAAQMVLTDLGEQGIDEIGSLTLQIAADKATDNTVVLEGRPATVVLHHGKAGYQRPSEEEYSLLYEDENLRISAAEPLMDESSQLIPLFIENVSDANCVISSESAQDENDRSVDAKIYGELLPKACLYTTLSLRGQTGDHDNLIYPQVLRFRINGFDTDMIGSLFVTSEFILTTAGAPEETRETEETELMEEETISPELIE